MKAATAACVEQEGYCVRSCWRESILLLRRKRGRHFWAFLEKGAKGKEALSSICALETQLSSSYLLKILLGMLIRFAFLVFFFTSYFFLSLERKSLPKRTFKKFEIFGFAIDCVIKVQLSIQIDVEYFFQQFKVKPLLKIFFIMILQGFQFFGFEFAE